MVRRGKALDETDLVHMASLTVQCDTYGTTPLLPMVRLARIVPRLRLSASLATEATSSQDFDFQYNAHIGILQRSAGQ